MSDNAADNTNDTSTEKSKTIDKSEFESLCRHVGRSLKGMGSSDASLAMHLMKESEHLRANGFDNGADMFSTIAGTLDPSLPVKMEIARRQVN